MSLHLQWLLLATILKVNFCRISSCKCICVVISFTEVVIDANVHDGMCDRKKRKQIRTQQMVTLPLHLEKMTHHLLRHHQLAVHQRQCSCRPLSGMQTA